MSEIHVEIRVISDNKSLNKTLINELDALFLKASILDEVSVEFKNIRTRERKPKQTFTIKDVLNSLPEETVVKIDQ